jgi:hypothetical protein
MIKGKKKSTLLILQRSYNRSCSLSDKLKFQEDKNGL